MIWFFYTFLNSIFLYVTYGLFNSVAVFAISYLILFAITLRHNIFNPVSFLYFSWNVLIINTFSGIIQYILPSNMDIVVLYVNLVLFIFNLGYNLYVKNKKVNIDFSKLNFDYLSLFSKIALIALLFNIIDFVLFLGGSLDSFSALRYLINNKESASVFSQLSALLYSGGFFSIICLFLSRNRTIFSILGVFAFALGSVLSAGRQQLFQIIILGLFLFLLKFRFKLRIKYMIVEKFLILVFILSASLYLFTLTTTRNTSDVQVDAAEVICFYEDMNNVKYSNDYKKFISYFPTEFQIMATEIYFYFSHELVALAEKVDNTILSPFDYKILSQFIFFERQIDKLFDLENSQYKRFNFGGKRYVRGYIDSTAWSTSLHAIIYVGYVFILIFVFFHGVASAFIVNRIDNSVYWFALYIGNMLFLYYTSICNLFNETSFLFFILICFGKILIINHGTRFDAKNINSNSLL